MVNAMSNNPAGQWLTVSLGDLTDAKERLSVAFRGTTTGPRATFASLDLLVAHPYANPAGTAANDGWKRPSVG